MRVFVALLAVISAARAASIASDYLPPISDNTLPIPDHIQPENKEESTVLADDGYRYKVVRKLRKRLRRDVNELPSNDYLPPAAEIKDATFAGQSVTQETLIVDATPEEKTLLTEDGYRYKTVRRLKYRHRRDVSELPISQYLPPSEVVQPLSEETSSIESEPEVKTQLADDGYRYKIVRRLKYRQRRDVSELPTNEYVPPSEPETPIVLEIESIPENKTNLAEDGYRYRTVRRLKYRHRRDVNELPVKEYLPPKEAETPISEEVSVAESGPEVKTNLAEDGYRYKVVRRLKYRHRRDVNELPAKDYLPPNKAEQPVSEEVAVVDSVPEVKTDLAEDGYRYKTVRRLKYRQRRDVSELPLNEYLPPTETKPSVSEEVSVVESEPEVKTELADDGYRYKVVRRLKYRHRRDVTELPKNEYLPPKEVESTVTEEVSMVQPEPEVKTELADDGYRYKVVRRLKYRHRRDVNELPANEYLPPTEAEQPIAEEMSVVKAEPEVKTDLAEDGYRYKIVRRLKYRQRRDVSELPLKEYLPPTEAEQPVTEDVSVVESEPEVKTELAEDGYRYKTVRRLKYRQRRDVSELPTSEYLPPNVIKSEISAGTEIVEPAAEVKTQLADDGYRYKTVRRLKYRRQ